MTEIVDVGGIKMQDADESVSQEERKENLESEMPVGMMGSTAGSGNGSKIEMIFYWPSIV